MGEGWSGTCVDPSRKKLGPEGTEREVGRHKLKKYIVSWHTHRWSLMLFFAGASKDGQVEGAGKKGGL